MGKGRARARMISNVGRITAEGPRIEALSGDTLS